MRHFRKFRKILATVMILALLIPAMPAALAESFSAFVQSSSMTVYADSGLTSKIGALAQYTVVTVTKYSGGVARIELNGKTGYAKVSDMTRVDAVAEPAVVNASAKVYQKASTSSKSASVAKNTKVNVIEVKGNWALIERNGVGGYIKAQYLTFTAETPILTASPTPAPTPDLSKAIPAVVSASSVTVYNRASTSGTSLGSIKKGTEVNVLDSSNGWAYIEMNGRYGYCKISALTPKSSVTPAPTATPDLSKAIPAVANVSVTVYQSASTSSKSLGTLKKGVQVNVLDSSSGWAYIEMSGRYGYCKISALTPVSSVTPAPTATPDLSKAIPAVANVSVTVYQSASTSSKSLGTLKKGVQVNVVDSSNGWAYIEMNGRYGYCKISALTPVSSVTPAPTATPDLSKAIPAVANVSVTVYQSASTSSKSLGTLKKGAQVNVVDSSSGWAYIEMNGRYGYCKISALTPVSSVTPAPTATPDLSKAIPAVVSASSVTVYQSASTSSKSLGTLKKGAQVNVVDSSNGWAYIEMNGRYGYCKISALTPVSSVTPAPTVDPEKVIPAVANVNVVVYQSASTSSKSLGTLKKGVQVNVLNVNGGWAYIEMSGRYGYCKVSALTPVSSVTPSPTPDLSKAIPAVVTASKLMVYDSASTSGKELGAIKKGTKVNVIQISGGWAYIEMNGRYGFCKVSGLAPEASATPDPLEGYVKETFSATVVVNGAKLYASASTSAASANLPLGTDVTVGAYSAEWAYVKVGETLGFIKVSALSKSQFAALSKGSSGSTVSTLEKALLAMGYFDGNPDTTFDAYTESAVKMFQEACGFSADGKASQSLQRVLYSGNGPVCSLLSGSYAKGSTGSNVGRIQLRLYALGYLSKTSSVDGDYGTTTANAVALFQKVSGLSQTGTADSSTLRKMYSTSAAKLPSGTTPADQGGSVIQQPNGSGQANNSTKISAGLASTTSKLTSGMSMAEKLEYVIYVGQNQLGKPYVYGANGTSSYDCTGFTVYCFKQIGITLKRTAVNQGYDDTYTKISGVSNLRRGDLVYFNTVSDSDLSDHAGIYLGDGWFIHASSGQGKVVISSLTSGYYNRVFSWGRRVY